MTKVLFDMSEVNNMNTLLYNRAKFKVQRHAHPDILEFSFKSKDMDTPSGMYVYNDTDIWASSRESLSSGFS